ncbi:neurotrophin receptor-interacting factor 1-like [Stegastes partitus]|uniref:Neurotrophin receptor-interacting factor 1-like n=1 Tax=Stegastes partitus TaxID=144197 RepID=A0A9Y4N4J1_9TELE|nr:PREDICTED: neurotrophin receptor-interacting factor 1-like [Stegastes partitus]
MSQIEELKVFVSERLHAAASEILGAIDKTITGYEEQTSRLKEDNERHRSLLDIILKSKLVQTEAFPANRSPPDAAAAAGPHALDARLKRKAREAPFNSPSGLQCVFTSCEDFLKYAANENCPYCLKRIQGTETHLMRRHYLFAVHFQDGTEKFVVPCMCKDKIQGRSHWHCPYCKKIIYRKCNFEVHLSKQHGYALLQQSQDAETNQPSVSEEEVPLSPEPWCHQGLCSLDQEEQQASLLLRLKEESEQVSYREEQCSEQLHTKGQGIENRNDQMGDQSRELNHAQNSAFNIVYVDSYIQDVGEISSVRSSRGHRLPRSSARAVETPPDGEVGKTVEPAGSSQHTSTIAENGSYTKTLEQRKPQTHCSNVKALNSKRKKRVSRSSPRVNIKKSTALPASQNPTGSFCCKACGKIFHYMYTLRTHVQTHAKDKTCICGICGKHLETTESLVQHLQSHAKRRKCGTCGKQFSTLSRLKRHRSFHRPKGLTVMSSA